MSKWFDPNTLDELVAEACEGDCLEFDRNYYKHWAVYVGFIKIGSRAGRSPFYTVFMFFNNQICVV